MLFDANIIYNLMHEECVPDEYEPVELGEWTLDPWSDLRSTRFVVFKFGGKYYQAWESRYGTSAGGYEYDSWDFAKGAECPEVVQVSKTIYTWEPV